MFLCRWFFLDKGSLGKLILLVVEPDLHLCFNIYMFYTKEDVHGVISTRLGSTLAIVNWMGAHLCVQAPSVAKQLCVWYQIPILWRPTESLLLLLTCVFFEASAKRCWRMKPCEEPTIPVARHLEGSLPLDAGCWCKSKHLQRPATVLQPYASRFRCGGFALTRI